VYEKVRAAPRTLLDLSIVDMPCVTAWLCSSLSAAVDTPIPIMSHKPVRVAVKRTLLVVIGTSTLFLLRRFQEPMRKE
jgi:hypothetical protein